LNSEKESLGVLVVVSVATASIGHSVSGRLFSLKESTNQVY
jgi:hypothetical protein